MGSIKTSRRKTKTTLPKNGRPNQKVRNATPNEYDGIAFKSKLEVYCYKQLKKYKLRPEYEKIAFTIIPEFTYDGEKVRKMTFTPDFVGKNKDYVIECKGYANESFPLRWKIFKYHLLTNNIKYNLYLPHNPREVDEVIEKLLELKRKKV